MGDAKLNDALAYLQQWFLEQCDGEWEEDYGVVLETLNNPGWHLRVPLTDTPLAGRTYDRRLHGHSTERWVDLRSDGTTFDAACGPLALQDVIDGFRAFAVAQPKSSRQSREPG